jgi:hypothetical protein
MIPPLGSTVRSTWTDKIYGKVVGYGTLFVGDNCKIQGAAPPKDPTVVILVWNHASPGSNSLVNPTVHVLSSEHIEMIEPVEKETV